MSEKYIAEETKHHEDDAAELDRLESNAERDSNDEVAETPKRNALPWIIAIAIIVLIGIISLALIAFKQSGKAEAKKDEEATTEKDKGGSNEVKLSPEVLASAGITTEAVTQRPAVALVTVAGTVEIDPQKTQLVTTLVSGRVEQVFVSIGDRVSAGQSVATVMSNEVAESYGKWREAITRVGLTQKNLERVKRSENRSSILQAKARMDEADATLKRTRRLIELGAGAGKDLVSAETNYKTAKAEYEFQSNISLNKEIQEAESDFQIAQVDAAEHQKQSLQALGVNVTSPNADVRNIASISLRSPVSGIGTARIVSGGAGVQAGTSLFTISNISTVWIIANVPENQMPQLRIGTPAEVRVAAFGEGVINGRVSYIDPQLNEETRTGRVRIEVANEDERLKAGMFVEVRFQAGTGTATGEELVVPSTAVHRLGDKNVVFIPKDDEIGAFEVREIEIGSAVEGYHRVLGGLKLGEKVVTKGSFTLKTQMQKGELGEE